MLNFLDLQDTCHVIFNAMGNLLCVVREPTEADNFINFVARLASDLKSHVHLLYVEEEYEYTIGRPPAPDNFAGQEQSKRLAEAKRVLSERVGTVLGDFRNEVSIDYSADLTSMISAIDSYVSSNRSDCVVLEAEEPKGLMVASPSNDELLDEINIPVLLVPRNTIHRPLRQVVYASAFSEKDIPAIRDLIRIVGVKQPSIRIIHISDESGSAEQMGSIGFADMVRRETGYKDITLEHLDKSNNDIPSQILDYSVRVNADMLVVLKEDRNFFERIFNPDRTKKIARDPDLPVLIYKI